MPQPFLKPVIRRLTNYSCQTLHAVLLRVRTLVP